MARVLVVSPDSALARGLWSTSFEIVDMRPQLLDAWIRADGEADAVILDLGDPQVALSALTDLRATAKRSAVLLLASDRAGWDAPGFRTFPACEVLPTPVGRFQMQTALEDLLVNGWAEAEPGELAERKHAEVAQVLHELALDREDLLTEDDALDGLITSSPPREPLPVVAPRSEPPAPRLREPVDPIGLVRQLAERTSDLNGVPETAAVILKDAVLHTRADAGALMVPDGSIWRVSAGEGLRPLEHRHQLDSSSWLVQQVARQHNGVIVQESDVARAQLQGAPLAGWRHLLVGPVPAVDAIVLLARREDPPFSETELTALATLGVEAGPLLTAALTTRDLARALASFRDELDTPH